MPNHHQLPLLLWELPSILPMLLLALLDLLTELLLLLLVAGVASPAGAAWVVAVLLLLTPSLDMPRTA